MSFPALRLKYLTSFLRHLLPLVLASSCVVAQDNNSPTHKLALGSHFSTGDYGATEDTNISYFPITYEFARFPWVLSVTAPYLGIDGPGDIFIETGNIGRTDPDDDELIDEDGAGDVFLSATYQLPPVFGGWVFVDLSLQAKLPTADETRDLGTGELDYGTQLDFYTTLGRNTWFSSLGYRKRGRTPLYDLGDSLFSSLGYMRQYGENTYLGLIYDYREKASSSSFEIHELMPFISHNLGDNWNVMVYTIAGFTDSSADRTLGVQLSYTFP